MSEHDTNIRIKTTADISGVEQTERAQDRLIAKTKDVGKASDEAGKKSVSAMEAFKGAVGKVQGALGAISFATAGWIAAWKSIKAEAESTRAAIEKMRADAFAHNLALAKADFEALKKNAAEMADKMAAAEKVQRGMLDNARGLRDAQLKVAEANEIAGVGQNDPDRDLKIQRIQQKYSSMRNTNSSSDKLEDIALRRKSNASTIAANEASIAGLEEQAADLADNEANLRSRAQAAALSGKRTITEKNWMGLSGRNWLGFSRGGESLEMTRKSEELMGSADAVKAEREAIQEHIRQLKRANEALKAENDVLDGQREVVATNRQAEAITEGAAAAATSAEQAKRNDRRAAAAAERERLTGSITSGESMAANLRRQIAFHERRYGAAVDVQSQAAFEENIARGDKSASGSAGLRAAQDAKYQADRTVAQITSVLGELTAKLKAVEDGLKRDRSRLASAKEDV